MYWIKKGWHRRHQQWAFWIEIIKIEYISINLNKFLVFTERFLISKSLLTYRNLYYIFDFLNHRMFGLSLTKTNSSGMLWLYERLYNCPWVLKQILDSFHTMVLMIESNLEDKLWDSTRKFQVTYLKYLHVYLHETSLRESRHHSSSVRVNWKDKDTFPKFHQKT